MTEFAGWFVSAIYEYRTSNQTGRPIRWTNLCFNFHVSSSLGSIPMSNCLTIFSKSLFCSKHTNRTNCFPLNSSCIKFKRRNTGRIKVSKPLASTRAFGLMSSADAPASIKASNVGWRFASTLSASRYGDDSAASSLMFVLIH